MSNVANLLLYKNNRKNSKTSDIISINELISEKPLSDERILDQFINTVEKCIYYCKQVDHIELSYHINFIKQGEFINASSKVNECYERLYIGRTRTQLYSIEQLINAIFTIYYIIYPYNKLSLKMIYENSSIKYIINNYYRKAL